MKVDFTPAARLDLIEIGDYLRQEAPRRASSFVKELVAKARNIGRTPYGFQLVERYAHRGVRRRPHRTYVIFYRVEDRQVSIIHILHGARDYESILFPEMDSN